MAQPRIVALAGSLRQGSYNKKLVRAAAAAARESGADVTYLDLRDFPLPIYDGDLQDALGLPAEAKALKKIFIDHQGILISSPEYNSSISGALKNAIDWMSRAETGEPNLVAFRGKVAALMSASPGALGGLRGLVHVRSILSSIGVLVLPEQLAVPKAHEAFNDDGALRDPQQQTRLAGLALALTQTVAKLFSSQT